MKIQVLSTGLAHLVHGGFVDQAVDDLRTIELISDADLARINAGLVTVSEVEDNRKGKTFKAQEAGDIVANGECASSFPTFDGTCVRDDNKGRTARPLTRLVKPMYCDGKNAPRCAKDGSELPNARHLSNRFHQDAQDQLTDRSQMSHMHMLWGQFIVHDMVLTPATKVAGTDCNCDNPTEECANIPIPEGDEHLTAKCIPVKRSARVETVLFGEKYEEQISVISSFIDGTVVYGTDSKLTETVRNWDRSNLAITYNANGLQLLPRSDSSGQSAPESRPLGSHNDTAAKFNPNPALNERGLPGYVAGDARANEHPALQGMHTVFHLLHNWVEERLVDVLGAEKEITDYVFHEARQVVISSLQHINYNAYLSTLLGPDFMKRADLKPSNKPQPFTPMPDVDPTIFCEFSTAAMRFGHSQINNQVPCLDSEWKEMEYVEQRLHDNFFDPYLVEKYGADSIVRGNIATPGMAVDTSFADAIRNNLFKAHDADKGGDLFAINIQRGREHGIGDYHSLRKWCRNNGYNAPVTYKPGMNALLRNEYDSMDDIDLYVGALAEEHLEGGVVGPTFGCLLAEQWKRLKLNNKYFHTNKDVYNQEQLDEVKKLDLATVLCAVGQDTVSVPKNPFFLTSKKGNPLVDCDSLDYPDFSAWAHSGSDKKETRKCLFTCKWKSADVTQPKALDCSDKNWDEITWMLNYAQETGTLPVQNMANGKDCFFIKNERVHTLILGNNQISSDQQIVDIIAALPKLAGIDVSNNALNTIPHEIFTLDSWKVSGNNATCVSVEDLDKSGAF